MLLWQFCCNEKTVPIWQRLVAQMQVIALLVRTHLLVTNPWRLAWRRNNSSGAKKDLRTCCNNHHEANGDMSTHSKSHDPIWSCVEPLLLCARKALCHTLVCQNIIFDVIRLLEINEQVFDCIKLFCSLHHSLFVLTHRHLSCCRTTTIVSASFRSTPRIGGAESSQLTYLLFCRPHTSMERIQFCLSSFRHCTMIEHVGKTFLNMLQTILHLICIVCKGPT
mmetsp:Transcript_3400/g.5491  ORF Transcript_3400/g.5491 Transcript_3400/m.5491 type:complete len:222 (-) Transcript_3400:148-813(-)